MKPRASTSQGPRNSSSSRTTLSFNNPDLQVAPSMALLQQQLGTHLVQGRNDAVRALVGDADARRGTFAKPGSNHRPSSTDAFAMRSRIIGAVVPAPGSQHQVAQLSNACSPSAISSTEGKGGPLIGCFTALRPATSGGEHPVTTAAKAARYAPRRSFQKLSSAAPTAIVEPADPARLPLPPSRTREKARTLGGTDLVSDLTPSRSLDSFAASWFQPITSASGKTSESAEVTTPSASKFESLDGIEELPGLGNQREKCRGSGNTRNIERWRKRGLNPQQSKGQSNKPDLAEYAHNTSNSEVGASSSSSVTTSPASASLNCNGADIREILSGDSSNEASSKAAGSRTADLYRWCVPDAVLPLSASPSAAADLLRPSTVEAMDRERERHRVEGDRLWRRASVLQARLDEALGVLQRYGGVTSTIELEAESRLALVQAEADLRWELMSKLLAQASRLPQKTAIHKVEDHAPPTVNPLRPVKDSELVRALRAAEVRVAELERLLSTTMPASHRMASTTTEGPASLIGSHSGFRPMSHTLRIVSCAPTIPPANAAPISSSAVAQKPVDPMRTRLS